MIPAVLRSSEYSELTIIAEADELLRYCLYLGFAKKEMHPLDAF